MTVMALVWTLKGEENIRPSGCLPDSNQRGAATSVSSSALLNSSGPFHHHRRAASPSPARTAAHVQRRGIAARLAAPLQPDQRAGEEPFCATSDRRGGGKGGSGYRTTTTSFAPETKSNASRTPSSASPNQDIALCGRTEGLRAVRGNTTAENAPRSSPLPRIRKLPRQSPRRGCQKSILRETVVFQKSNAPVWHHLQQSGVREPGTTFEGSKVVGYCLCLS